MVLRRFFADVLSEQGCGEGDKSHAHQEQDVQEEQDVVRTWDQTEAVVMVRPHGTDNEEAGRVPQIRRPQVYEALEERALFADVGNPYLYDKQRDRDGEDRV